MAQAQQAATLKCTLTGRVEQVTRKTGKAGELYLTLLKTPAADAYSSPSTFEIRSGRRLGGEGSEVTVDVTLQGYARAYNTKDGERVKTAECVLQAV